MKSLMQATPAKGDLSRVVFEKRFPSWLVVPIPRRASMMRPGWSNGRVSRPMPRAVLERSPYLRGDCPREGRPAIFAGVFLSALMLRPNPAGTRGQEIAARLPK
jgi:hypothetical protein